MNRDLFELYAPEPFADAAWCGTCAACAAARRRPSAGCGCPAGWRCADAPSAVTTGVARVATVPRHGAGPTSPSCLHALGRRLAHALFYRAPLHLLPVLKPTHVLTQSVAVANRARRAAGARSVPGDIDTAGLTYYQGLVLVTSHLQHLVTTGDLSERTVQKMVADMAAMAMFMTSGLGRPLVAQASAADVARWIDAPLAGRRRAGQEAAATTRRLRRSAARLFFKVLRHLGMFASDPTMDVTVPAAAGSSTVPLEDDELLQLRYACVTDAHDTRLPSVLALAEATATTGELALVRIGDVNLSAAWVHLRGHSRRQPRRSPLSPWAVKVLTRRIQTLTAQGAGSDTLIVYAGEQAQSSETPGVSTARAVHRLLELADLAGQPGIRPGSIPAAFGKRVWDQTHDIALVAHALGCRSLDGAAKSIGVSPSAQLEDIEARLRGCLLADEHRLYQRGKKVRRAAQQAKPRTNTAAIAPSRAPQHRSSAWQAGK